jgi:hypothetical protein
MQTNLVHLPLELQNTRFALEIDELENICKSELLKTLQPSLFILCIVIILEKIYITAAKKIADHVKKLCAKSKPAPANIVFVTGINRKNRKGHRNKNP